MHEWCWSRFLLPWIKQNVCAAINHLPPQLIEPLLFTGFRSSLKMFVSQFCARSFLPHVQPPNMHYVLNSGHWGQRVVTFSLTLSIGCTSGCDKLPTPPVWLSVIIWACGLQHYLPQRIKLKKINHDPSLSFIWQHWGLSSACVYISFLTKCLDETEYANKCNRCS